MNGSLRSMVDMAFCINLDRRVDRWEHASAQFSKRGLAVHRFSAVDGSVLPLGVVPRPVGLTVPMTPGVYASLLSHLSVIELARNMNLRGVLIFEDDVVIHPLWDKLLPLVAEHTPKDWDLFFWGGRVVLDKGGVAPYISRPTNMFMIYAYMVSCRAYTKVIEALRTKNHWADQIIGGLCPQLNAYTTYPRPCSQLPRRFDSDNLGIGRVPPQAVLDAEKIQGWMSREELGWLYERARESARVLEIGCWKGRSTRVLCGGAAGKVLAFDHFRGDDHPNNFHKEARDNPGSIREAFTANLAPWIRSGVLCAVGRDVRKPGTDDHIRRWLGEERLDFAFIDGSHTDGHPALDIELVLPFVRAGGILAGHDYHPGVWDEVVRAVDAKFGARVRRGPGTIWYVVV